jgi:putative ABC transport system permease protein
VGDVRQSALEQAASPEIFVVGEGRYLEVRTKGKLGSITLSVRNVFRELDPTMAVPEAKPLSQIIDRAVSRRRLIALLLAPFSLLALLLASLGIYGTIDYCVSQRTQEIGIRMALGSSMSAVLRLILGEGMGLAFLGCGLGLIAALALSQLLEALLFGISAVDPLTFLVCGILVSVMALAACLLPALRASRVDPMVALRHD